MPTNEAIRPHALTINLNSQMLAIVYSSVSNVVFLSYVGMKVLLVSLRVPYCLPTPPFVLHCWMRNSIACVSIRVYDPVGVFAHQLPTYHLFCCPLGKVGPTGLALVTIDFHISLHLAYPW